MIVSCLYDVRLFCNPHLIKEEGEYVDTILHKPNYIYEKSPIQKFYFVQEI